MSDFLSYQLALTKQQARQAEFEASAVRLELAAIRVRCSELQSQAFEFVADGALKKNFPNLTEAHLFASRALCRYVLCGRTDNNQP